jgi:DNA-binding response OmpR family regulator
MQPAGTDKTSENKSRSTDEEAVVIEKKRVLVVDDELDMLMVIKLRLEASGYEVVTATDGLEGLNTARRVKPDLIVLDVMLPKMNGYKVSRFLKYDEEYKHIPIVMLTALAGEEDRSTGIETGANAYITKPFETQELVDTVRRFLQ